MAFDSFFFGPDLKTVIGRQGPFETAFKTEEEALAAGVLKNPAYNPALPNSASNPFFSNVSFPDESLAGIPPTGLGIPPTIPADILKSIVSPEPKESLVDMFNRVRTQFGLPELQSRQQELLKSIQEGKAGLEEGLIKEEGRTIAQPLIGARQQVLREQVARTLQPLVDTFNLNAQQISNIQKEIETQVGLAGKERQFQAQERQRQIQNFLEIAKLQQGERESRIREERNALQDRLAQAKFELDLLKEQRYISDAEYRKQQDTITNQFRDQGLQLRNLEVSARIAELQRKAEEEAYSLDDVSDYAVGLEDGVAQIGDVPKAQRPKVINAAKALALLRDDIQKNNASGEITDKTLLINSLAKSYKELSPKTIAAEVDTFFSPKIKPTAPTGLESFTFPTKEFGTVGSFFGRLWSGGLNLLR